MINEIRQNISENSVGKCIFLLLHIKTTEKPSDDASYIGFEF